MEHLGRPLKELEGVQAVAVQSLQASDVVWLYTLMYSLVRSVRRLRPPTN